MNYIDIFILVLLIWAVFQGFTRGFIMQLSTLIALILGIYAALKFSGITSRYLESRINMGAEPLFLLSIGVTFIVVFIAVNLVGKLIEKVAESIELSLVNRSLGVLFSLCKTVLLLGVLLTFVDRIDKQVKILPPGSQEHSIFFKPFTALAKTLFPSLKTNDPANHEQGREFV
jgi:membrane protein required for colicin V production